MWAKYIGDAYLEANTLEKVYIVAGADVGDREGHIYIFPKAICGIFSSVLRWHEMFSDYLIDMGFFPWNLKPDICIRHNGDIY